MIVEGKLFNWEKASVYHGRDDVWVRRISFFGNGDHWGCNWNNNRLSISELSYSSNTSISIECDLDMAETIVIGFAKANNFEIMPLHKK